jgi:LDH2 family malate/lactate/ureidoglycolate dehydrogenase
MAVAAVRHWQFVVGGPYARLAAEAGLIGFACTNFIPLVAPPGGRSAVFGTNPMAFAIPAQRHPPVVLDMATTVNPLQKVRVAAQRRERMPEGVLLDREAHPITDPEAFLRQGGLLAPLGFPLVPHKGFGLALVIDVLSGVLTGSAYAQGMATGTPGTFLWALDVEAFMPRHEFLERMDAQLDQVKQGERLAGVGELVLPGERGHRRLERLRAEGAVPVTQASWEVLEAACDALAVALPAVVAEP